jgi:Zn-dependent protease
MRIANLFGIPLYLHWSWFLLLVLVGVFNGPTSLLVILGMFFLVLLHEYGHCFAARCYGLEVTDVTLYPVGGLARIESLGDQSPWTRELVISLAGPLVNIVLCILSMLVILTMPELMKADGEATIFGLICHYSFVLNIGLAIFNLLPIFPMDGGRVLRASLFGVMRDYEGATVVAVRMGQVLACGMIFLAILTQQFMLGLIFFLVCLGSQAELIAVQRQASLERLKIHLSEVLEKPELLNANLPQLIDILEDVEDEELKKKLTLDELLPMLKQHLESQQNQQNS